MTSYRYRLECGHEQKHPRPVKVVNGATMPPVSSVHAPKRQKWPKGGYLWCKTCRMHVRVIRLTIDKFKQPKLTTFRGQTRG